MTASLDVLVADDEPKIRQLLTQILQANDCTVRIAEDGLDALSQFQQQPADLVLTDIKMPRLSGLELVGELKRLDPMAQVVVITAYPSVEGAVEAMKLGASDFITKPFDLIQVQAVLFRCRQRLALARELRSTHEGLVKVEELNRRLTDLNDLKMRFLAAISHELNTPMALLSEWIRLFADGSLGTVSTDQQQAIDVLLKAYERLHRILQQLVDLMHGYDMLLHRQTLTAQELIRHAVAVITPKAAERQITIACQMPDSPVTFEGDRHRCEAALEYLIDNAVQFTEEGGRVTIAVKGTADAVQVEVRDTGIGIPPEKQEKVFEPFYQGDQFMGRTQKGAGIGLTLAKRYVELHGGTLQLASEVGRGTTVTVSLPRRLSEKPALPQLSSAL